MATKAIVLYMPVYHEGYRKFFIRNTECGILDVWVVGDELVRELTISAPEIRALPAKTACSILKADLNLTVNVLTADNIGSLSEIEIVSPKDALVERLIEKYLTQNKVVWDSVFLRWDEKNVLSSHDVYYDRVSNDGFDRDMMVLATEKSKNGSCWWRQVGALAVKGDQQLFSTHNDHVPSRYDHYFDGDPRDSIEAGKHGELATTLHAEQALIAQAANEGISLRGASLYLTVFPCPMCANMVANSGIKKLYFRTGNAYLHSEHVLKAKGIEIVFVK